MKAGEFHADLLEANKAVKTFASSQRPSCVFLRGGHAENHRLFRRSAVIALRRTALFFAVLLFSVLAACAQDKATQPLAPMARVADPAFEVSRVIKRANPDARSQGFSLMGHRISIPQKRDDNPYLFAFSIQKSQMVNAVRWFDEQRWNIDGIPD